MMAQGHTVEPQAEAGHGTTADAAVAVSVIVPCYNAAAYLARTIESVLQQSHRDLELIVVDDLSTDGSADIVLRYAARDPRVRLLRMPRNTGGPAAPRNAGVAAARGRWLAFLDADDLWHTRKLEAQLGVLEQSGLAMCSAQMLDFIDGTERVERALPVPLPLLRVTLTQQLVKYRTPTSSIVIRRELLGARPFNEDP